MSTYEDMIYEIVRLRMALIANNMAGGCCPYALYPLENKGKQDVCGTVPCRTCHHKWRIQKEREVWEETMEQFEKDQKWAFVEKEGKVYVKDMDTVIEDEKIIGWSRDIRTACNKARKHARQGYCLEYVKREHLTA